MIIIQLLKQHFTKIAATYQNNNNIKEDQHFNSIFMLEQYNIITLKQHHNNGMGMKKCYNYSVATVRQYNPRIIAHDSATRP